MRKIWCILLLAAVFFSKYSVACTEFRLKAKDGSLMITRSMEFARSFDSNIRVSARGRNFETYAPDNSKTMAWKSSFGYLYLDGMNEDVVVDGVNEKGLSFQYLYLPDEAKYQSFEKSSQKNSLPYLDFGHWVLGNFSNIADLKTALNNIRVINGYVPAFKNFIFPLHASVYQKDGQGIVIEFYDNKINVYDHLGVMTNSPKYPWHLVNLTNYLRLSPLNPKPIEHNNMYFSPLGQGSGAIGLPGDYSPASRFVKIVFLTKYATQPENEVDLLNSSEHIINTVDIPEGAVQDKQNNHIVSEKTEWVVFKDLKNMKLYWRTYNNLKLYMIDLNKINWTQGNHKILPMNIPTVTEDLTAKIL